MGRLPIKHYKQVIDFDYMIQTKEDLYRFLEMDKKAMRIPKQTIKRKIANFFNPHEIWKFVRLLRFAEYYSNCKSKNPFFRVYKIIMTLYYKYRLKKQSLRLGFSIPINTCGPVLSIAHHGTIVINASTRIGANCRIHACVNIGASAGKKEAPVIGDNCYIGPGAIIFGGIHIADNTTIGANATVNKSFDTPNVIIAGTPAKIVKENTPNWLEFNGLMA